MKKTYINPSMLVVGIQTRTFLAGSGLSKNADGTLTGSLYDDEEASGDGLAKGISDINIWDDDDEW